MANSSTTTPVNHAVVIPQARAYPMRIETVPYPTVGTDEIVIQVGAVAINPVDQKIQVHGDTHFSYLQYPYVTGSDVAGTVVEVGPGAVAAHFSVGDHVLAVSLDMEARQGAFQEYVVVHANLSTKIPPTVSLTDAAVLPVGVMTAATALYEPGHLELALPTLDATPESQNQVVLVWGGAASVGTNVIQLATASGYEVFTTSSPHNFELCRSLGASQVFDYKSATVVADIVSALNGKTIAGAVSVVTSAHSTVYEVVGNNEVQGVKKVACVMSFEDFPQPPANVTASKVWGGTSQENFVGVKMFHNYLEKAIARGVYQFKPPALVVGKGLGAVQDAVDKVTEGKSSANKLVVTFE